MLVLGLGVACFGGDGKAFASAVSGGTFHTCALTTDGGVTCWGSNSNGQLGDGTSDRRRNTPDYVQGLKRGIAAISAGELHACALTTDGGVKCWGANLNGQLGDGTNVDQSAPVDVVGLTSGVVAISAGSLHTCALTKEGGVTCWGHVLVGELTLVEQERGTGMATDAVTPVVVEGLESGIVAISSGTLHTCALTTQGGVKCWGYNREGQLGNGDQNDRGTPVDVVGLTSGVVAVTTGWKHSCAVTIEGALKCWGWNDGGQLGDGTTLNSTIPIDVDGLSGGIAAVSAGRQHSCALTTSGGLKCWGLSDGGQLGDGTDDQRTSPVGVAGLDSGIAGVSAGLLHTCAVTSEGSIKCWGVNSSGQLGIGAPSGLHRNAPVTVVGYEFP